LDHVVAGVAVAVEVAVLVAFGDRHPGRGARDERLPSVRLGETGVPHLQRLRVEQPPPIPRHDQASRHRCGGIAADHLEHDVVEVVVAVEVASGPREQRVLVRVDDHAAFMDAEWIPVDRRVDHPVGARPVELEHKVRLIAVPVEVAPAQPLRESKAKDGTVRRPA
jgi:hypothetical protein